jgi:hypothetical protein
MLTAQDSYAPLAPPAAPAAAPAVCPEARADLRRQLRRHARVAVTWAVGVGLLAILFVIPLAAYL